MEIGSAKSILFTTVAAVFLCLVPLGAFGHGGGVDKCGGHKDKKSGGYHVHNRVRYCACHPKSEECRASEKPAPKEKK